MPLNTMPLTDWTAPRAGRLAYSHENFAAAKIFMIAKWRDRAALSSAAAPIDLSGACKYGSLFVQCVFGGAIRGHYEHQFNFIEGRLVDLSHDALDVGRMRNPYLHEPAYFLVPEIQASLAGCLPRAERWADEFLALQGWAPSD